MARVWDSIISLAAILCVCAVAAQRKPIKEALFLNTDVFNSTAEDCVWRREREPCPDPDVTLNLYTEAEPYKKEVDLFSEDWLRQSSWEPSHETILLIHGYAGGDDTLPIVVLRDAYLRRGGYNVFMMDWGQLAQPPCYVAAVHNLRPVARCVAEALGSLRRAGLRPDRLTCVGHSLGAHMCGIMANYLNFRLNRIIGLDPARPLIRSAPALRLDPGDARAVHVLHTNAGRYGEGARLGHADFCLNGGRSQPYCEDTPNEALCSHVWSICYQAESLFRARSAAPCGRRCAVRVPPGRAAALPVPLGQPAPMTASGAYCVEDFTTPFCPSTSGLAEGDSRCCLDKQYAAAATTARPPRSRPRPVARLRARRLSAHHQNVTPLDAHHQNITLLNAHNQNVTLLNAQHQNVTPPDAHHQNDTLLNAHHQNDTLLNAHHQNDTLLNAHNQNDTLLNAHHQNDTLLNAHHQNDTLLNAHNQNVTLDITNNF